MRRISVVIALWAGLVLAAQAFLTYTGVEVARAVVPLVLAAGVPYFIDRRLLDRLLAALDDRSPGRRRWACVVIFFGSLLYFVVSAKIGGRGFHPTWHDDQMHAVQTQMLAHGRLWHGPHPMADFFDTFHIFMRPVYAPIHFPGTAILNVPAVWLGLNWSVIPLMLASLGCVLVYLVVFELIDGTSAVLAVLFALAADQLRMLATMMTSHNAMLCLGPLMLWLFLRWRKRPTVLWSLALGAAVSLAGFTRPVDAIAYAVPIGIGVLVETFRRRPHRWAMIPLMVATGLPLIGLQLAFDKAVTGNALYPPYAAYNDQFHPNTTYGSVSKIDPRHLPRVSDLPQKQIYYERFMLPQAFDFATLPMLIIVLQIRVPQTLLNTLPGAVMYAMVPLGLFGLTTLRRWVTAVPPVLMVVLYLPHAYYLPHYPPLVLTGMSVLALLGLSRIAAWLQPRFPLARPLLVGVAGFTALSNCTPFSMLNGIEMTTGTFRSVNYTYEQLPQRVEKPALVFCQISDANFNFHDEPVYNTRAAWPDDADIVLAQSLGRRNEELVRYYHDLGQDRHVYLLDRNRLTLRSFGTVDGLVRESEANAATRPATRPLE